MSTLVIVAVGVIWKTAFFEPDEVGGSNGNISLNQARENWQKGLNARGEPIKK